MIFKLSLAVRFALFCLLLCFPFFARGQNGETPIITADKLANDKTVALDKTIWKYRSGDDAAWAAKDFDDSRWEQMQETRLNPQALPASGWNGRAWFRLRFRVDESAANKNLSLSGSHYGASEVYLDGRLLTAFGEILETGEIEYNPNGIPVPFKLDSGDHVLAVRYSASALGESSSWRGAWLTRGGVHPGFIFSIAEISDFKAMIQKYANATSRRIPFFFVGMLSALALLHLLLFVFYSVERANLLYSIHAFAFAFHLIFSNVLGFSHLGAVPSVILSFANSVSVCILFVALLAFLHVAFNRVLGIAFWLIAGLWFLSIVLNAIYLRALGSWAILSSFATSATFGFSIFLLVQALRQKRSGAWILMSGMQLFAIAMFFQLLRVFGVLTQPADFYFLVELAIVLSIPVAISIYLARNFARTSRDLTQQLATVEQLSARQIEQERRAAELRVEHERTRAENERRAKELEEARQLQLSLLPKKLPDFPNLEIAAFMKPATEVGGDYYDFYVGADGTLTAVIGDATGHGLKAGSVVTATKSLFNAFADDQNIGRILGQTNRALKRMNLRGLFMALAMLKIRGNRLTLSVAGMPPMLLYKAATGEIEEIAIRAMPLGSISDISYQEREIQLASGDVLVLMSDGFPEMFNAAGEMLEDDAAKKVLAESADLSPQEIINRFVQVGENWAGTRPPDDDVTFVVLKVK